MIEAVARDFIDKAISNTKSKKIKWYSLKGHEALLRQQSSIVSDAIAGATILNPSLSDLVSIDNSYYAIFKTGYIFFLFISNDLSHAIDFSGAFHKFSLRIQNEGSPYAKEIASSEDSSDFSIQLKRLYNLAQDSASDLDDFIDDFLNS